MGWKKCSFVICLGALLGMASEARADLVINEIMSRPINQSTNGQYEFIELFNTGNTAVDIGGYILTDSENWANFCNDPMPTSTNDNEGYVIIDANTIVPANSYFTLWHNTVPGVTNQPNTYVYSNSAIANVVLLDSGDQVTLLKCENGVPVVVDSVDLSSVGPGTPDHNISIERVDPAVASNVSSNWKFSKGISRTGLNMSGYIIGGTPGGVNTVSCPTDYAFHEGECVAGNGLLVLTYNQNEYENNWQSTRTGGTAQFIGFRDEMSSRGAEIFDNKTLKQENGILKSMEIQDCEGTPDHPNNQCSDDSNGTDSADFVMIGTHGNDNGGLTLYEENQRAQIKGMRLGDDSRKASLLGLWVCDTLAEYSSTQEHRSVRWERIFSGGLRYVAGFRGSHMRGTTTNNDGEDFADRLMDGNTIKNAFGYAMGDWFNDLMHWAFDWDNNEPTVAASGRNDSDCSQRLKRMKVQTMINVERLRWTPGSMPDNYCLCFYDIEEDFWN